MVLHADEVDYNEKTGEIAARGNVPLPLAKAHCPDLDFRDGSGALLYCASR